ADPQVLLDTRLIVEQKHALEAVVVGEESDADDQQREQLGQHSRERCARVAFAAHGLGDRRHRCAAAWRVAPLWRAGVALTRDEPTAEVISFGEMNWASTLRSGLGLRCFCRLEIPGRIRE